MKQRPEITNSTPLKSSRELAEMLRKLPRDERLRVEGIVIGIALRSDVQPPSDQPSI